jgi:hypothetical protein
MLKSSHHHCRPIIQIWHHGFHRAKCKRGRSSAKIFSPILLQFRRKVSWYNTPLNSYVLAIAHDLTYSMLNITAHFLCAEDKTFSTFAARETDGLGNPVDPKASGRPQAPLQYQPGTSGVSSPL